ncbi:MAG: hypothetical protein QM820_41670 [Minicystis sp.]
MSAGPRPASAAIQRAPGSRWVAGFEVRLQPQEERADLDLPLHVVHLREGVVVERERGVARRDLADVVAEGGGRVAVLDEVPAGAGEGVAAGEARDLGDAIHAVAALGREGERDLAGAELGPDHLDGERAEDVGQRPLPRVEREERDQPVDRGQQDEALGAERHALGVETEARRTQAGLVDGDAIEHARATRPRRGGGAATWREP